MKELKFLCIQPDDVYYTWQVHAWLESLKQIGQSDKAIILLFVPHFREQNPKWQQIIDLYPEAEFVFYKDVNNEISSKLGIYIPVLRPWTAAKYFKEHPEMKDKAIFYCDSDVVFSKMPDISEYINDDVNYLSDTNSYINADYFDSKVRDVLPERLEEYKLEDVLAQTTMLAGVTRKIAEENNLHSGGAQYLLKNIDYTFWEKVEKDCLSIRIYLMDVNKQFFKDESSGFQSWCSDMWAVLYNLWYDKQTTKVIPELDFAWATDPISKLDRVSIFHNAGIVSNTANGYPAFYKGNYHSGGNPVTDPHLQVVINDANSQKHCTHYYAQQLLNLKNKYNLQY